MFNLLYSIDPSFVKEKVIMSNEQRKSVEKMDEGGYNKINKELLKEIEDLRLLPSQYQ